MSCQLKLRIKGIDKGHAIHGPRGLAGSTPTTTIERGENTGQAAQKPSTRKLLAPACVLPSRSLI